MKRKGLYGLLLTCSLLLPGCKSDSEYEEYSLNDLIDSEIIYNVADSSYNISMLWDIKIYRDSLAIFADFYSHTIYKYNLYNKEITKLGSIGKGPGEYLEPFGLLIKNDLIYYSDALERGIESFDLNGKNPKRIDNIYLDLFCPQKYVIDQNGTFFYLVEKAFQGYYVSSSKGGKYGKALKILSDNNRARYPFAGIYLNNNKLYFMNMVESKIYCVNLENGEEEYNKINVKGFFNWDNVQNEKLTAEMNENTRILYSRVGNFKGFQFNGKTFFYFHVNNEISGPMDIICNEQGDILFSIKDKGDYGFIDITEDKSYIYTINENEFLIKSFKWNKKFTDLLNKAE